VGVCGRTGAGKSSLITMLLRLVPPESGRVLIDGTDISKIGVKTLRSRLAIVPQDPIIYTGTLSAGRFHSAEAFVAKTAARVG
jgi:ABC-type multidrug transport system fused ATPase/permease subunit